MTKKLQYSVIKDFLITVLDGNVQMLERAFEGAGFKFLSLNGDAVDESNTTFDQHRTRIEAFMERK